MLEELEAAISTQEQRGAIQQESGGVNQGQVELSKADEVSRGRAQVREGMSNAVPQNEAPLQESAVVAASMEIRLSEEISPPQEASVLQAPGTAQEAPPAGMERITPVEKVSEEKKMEKTRSPLEEPEPSDSAEDAPVERPEGEIFAGDLVALQSSVGDSLDPGFTESTVALDLSAIEKAVERQVGDVKLSETQEVPVIEVPEETGDELASLEEVLSFSSEFESLSADYPKTPEGGIEKVTASSGAEVEPLAEVSGQRDSTGRVEATLQSETLSEPEMGPPQRDDFATESLAELYVKQGYYNKGIEIYKSLLKADPENRAIRQKLEDAVTLANLLIGRNEQEMTAQDSHSFLNPEAWGLTQDRERGGPEEQPQGRPPLREVQADKLASSKEDAKLVKIQRLQVWLENIKKGQQS
jgi:hypothetical protein